MAHINITNTGVGGTQAGPALTASSIQSHAIATNNSDAAVFFRLRGPAPANTESELFKVDANNYLIVPFPAATGNHSIVDVETAHRTSAQSGEFLYVFQADPPTDFADVYNEHYANGRTR